VQKRGSGAMRPGVAGTDAFLSAPTSLYGCPAASLGAIRTAASSLSYKSGQKDERAARQATTAPRAVPRHRDLIHC